MQSSAYQQRFADKDFTPANRALPPMGGYQIKKFFVDLMYGLLWGQPVQRPEGDATLNLPKKQRSTLFETIQSGLPAFSGRAAEVLAVPGGAQACERFFFQTFDGCQYPVMIYDRLGQRLIHPRAQGGKSAIPESLPCFDSCTKTPTFVTSNDTLLFIFDRLDRWPVAPAKVAFVAVLIERELFNAVTGISLTPSEYSLVSLLLAGHNLQSAADYTGANYDTKRKQARTVLEKAGLNGQAALLREVSLAITSDVLNDLLQPNQRRPEVELAQRTYGRDIVIHSISIGDSHDVPVWEFGARRGQSILYFHSMLAPTIFTTNMVETLRKRNLRILMIPRHFFRAEPGGRGVQDQILQAASDIAGYFCGEPVICMGESAGCAWAAQFTRAFPDQVSELVLVATPQAIGPRDGERFLPRSLTLLMEVSDRVRKDDRVIAGLTSVYNAITRVPALSRRTLDFMFRHVSSDLATIEDSYDKLFLGDWLRLIANKATRASIDEVAHLHSDWVLDMQNLTRPTRFFHGTEDTLCPIEDLKAMVDVLPTATIQAFEGNGHLVLGQRLDGILACLAADRKPVEPVR